MFFLRTGTFIKNERYGEQVSVESVKILPPNDTEGIIKYLSSGLIRGIGEVTARNIVDVYFAAPAPAGE